MGCTPLGAGMPETGHPVGPMPLPHLPTWESMPRAVPALGITFYGRFRPETTKCHNLIFI